MYYAPRQTGIVKAVAGEVVYQESQPPEAVADLVYCFWELRTTHSLNASFDYLVIPDACVDIVFDLQHPEALFMTPHVTSVCLDLGKEFHFVGIRLHPGVFTGELSEIVGNTLQLDSLGGENICDIVGRLATMPFANQQQELTQLVHILARENTLKSNALIRRIIQLSETHTINEIAKIVHISERQLRRIVRTATGFSPKELARVTTFQRSFSSPWQGLYTDQAHYIHSFKQITKTTPQRYQRLYDAQ